MKHQIDLIEKILTHAENQTYLSKAEDVESLRGSDKRVVDEHINALIQNELLHGQTDGTENRYVIHGICQKGSRFLKSIRSESLRGKIKNVERELGGRMSIEVMYDIIKDFSADFF